jgi:glycopeptide antibiotics resistance protein
VTQVERYSLTKFGPLLLWIGTIMGIASLPKAAILRPDAEPMFALSQHLIATLYHVGAFFILAILFQFSVEKKSGDLFPTWVVAFIGSAVISIISEAIQFYIPTRTPSVRDLSFDLFGTLLGLFYARTSR